MHSSTGSRSEWLELGRLGRGTRPIGLEATDGFDYTHVINVGMSVWLS